MTSNNFELSSLPFEIADRISKHLDNASLANCCLVNKHWYTCFISSVWESPKTRSLENLKSLHHSMESIASFIDEEENDNDNENKENNNENKNDKNNNENNNNISFTDYFNHLKMVKHLDLTAVVDESDIKASNDQTKTFDYADTETQSLLIKLADHCSSLKSLALKVPSEKNSSKDAPKFFFALKQFAKSALSLESLTLDFNDMTVFADHLQEAIPVECFTKLHHLNLQNASMVDDSAFIWLWSNCPSLTSVTISQSSNLNDYILNPLIRIHGHQIKSFDLERCSRLSPNSILNIIVSCKNLEKFRWVNNGAIYNSTLLSTTTTTNDFEIKDMAFFMNALKENCVIEHLKDLDYAFLQESQASIIFDFLIEKNRETLESIKCDTSKALISAVQKNIIFPHLKEISFNNPSVSLEKLSKQSSSTTTTTTLNENCQMSSTSNVSIEGNSSTSLTA
ncbi:hypothetical protein BCR32DRAFT_273058 [Anaeromyces robustus]|uniref:F-box domain-containing protein n=1 Tax=Anaeromyces robustus TaxID=1754192 RepID=A0A1Y1VTR3_9FUNG|nr:hypothetical protein BCR32DRAFT_273058 [Anaeromyces robustus]|eukprot:ORX64573.1 hypothetical protein BCR32DRAFT_273058 [Anaeromyces robustus]